MKNLLIESLKRALYTALETILPMLALGQAITQIDYQEILLVAGGTFICAFVRVFTMEFKKVYHIEELDELEDEEDYE